MKTYDICIIEDELPAALALEQDVRSYCPQAGRIWTHTSLHEGIRSIEMHPPGIVLLDIQLGKHNGFELFSFFPRPAFQTIMVTAYESFALRAIKAQVAAYLLKPVGATQIQQAFQTAISRIENEKQPANRPYAGRMAIPAQDRITLIETANILYCTAQSNYCWIFLKNGDKLCASVTLGTITQKLDPELFIRVHQSYLVGRKSIYRFFHADGGKIELENGATIPVSRSYKQALLDYIKSFTAR